MKSLCPINVKLNFLSEFSRTEILHILTDSISNVICHTGTGGKMDGRYVRFEIENYTCARVEIYAREKQEAGGAAVCGSLLHHQASQEASKAPGEEAENVGPYVKLKIDLGCNFSHFFKS